MTATEAFPVPPAQSDGSVLLDVSELTVAYKDKEGTEIRLVDDVSFQLRRGEALGLAGESGCGKTTTALSILGLLPSNLYRAHGTITVNSERGIMHVHRRTDRGLRDLRWNTVSIVFQGAMNALDPVMRVSSQIGEAIRLHDPDASDAEVAQRIAELFEYVGMSPARATQYPHEFSGGMRQRVMIALALACKPELIIGDEPTTALDVMMQAQILELLEELRRELGPRDDPDHARPLRTRRDLRPRRDHVRRPDRRVRPDPRALPPPPAPVYAAAPRRIPDRRRAARARSRNSGRPAGSGSTPRRLPVRTPLPQGPAACASVDQLARIDDTHGRGSSALAPVSCPARRRR